MTPDIRPRIAAAQHDLDRLLTALPRAWIDGWSPIRAIDLGRQRIRGSNDHTTPQAAETIALDGYRRSAQHLAHAHNALANLGWRSIWHHRDILTSTRDGQPLTHHRQPHTRTLHTDGSHCHATGPCALDHQQHTIQPMRMPEPAELTLAIYKLRGALEHIAKCLDHYPADGITRLCDHIEQALHALPEGIRNPPRPATPERPRCANPTCKGRVSPSQQSPWCQTCRNHRAKWKTDRILDATRRCICASCTRRRSS